MSHSILKISKPTLPEVLSRERLFHALDNALEIPLTWIAAPPGSGKTTLLASYLDARSLDYIWYRMDERDSDIPNFIHFLCQAAYGVIGSDTHNLLGYSSPPQLAHFGNYNAFFDKLYSALPRPFVFVFDDSPGFGENSEIMDAMISAFETASAGISFVVMSRFMPPFRLARFQARRQMTLLTWDDLQFTRNETIKLFMLLAPEKKISSNDKLLTMIDGWATGVVLETVTSRFVPVAETREVREPGKNFAYFASEVLAHLEGDTRLFLLRSAFLPWMTGEMNSRLTGNANAGKILHGMHSRCCFTERINGTEPAYKFHPLFREFLLTNACLTFPPREIDSLEQTAARLLEEAGAVEEAAEIHLHTRSWDLLINLVDRYAGQFVRQGREKVMYQWLEAIPGKVASRSHVVAYWKGVEALSCCKQNAKDLFAAAFELGKGKDDAITLLAWSGIVNSIQVAWGDFGQLDTWICWLEEYLHAHTDYPSPEVECQVALSISWALTIRQPHRVEILSSWLARAQVLAKESGDPRLINTMWVTSANYYAWKGDHPMYRMAIEELNKHCSSEQSPTPTAVISNWLEGISRACIDADSGASLAISHAGLAKAKSLGTGELNHLFHALSVYALHMEEKLDDAGESLDAMFGCLKSSKKHSYAHYYFLAAWHALLKDDLQGAASHAEQAVRFAEETGFVFPEVLCRLALARVQHEIGEDELACENLHHATSQALPTESTMLKFMCLVFEALFSSETTEYQRTSDLLRMAFALGRRHGYVNLFWWWLPDDMSRLCGLALERGIEPAYVRKLIQRRGLKPAKRRFQVEAWPWAVKIYTMGRFGIVLNGAPINFSGKVQQKPLALLKAIIALGGRNVSEEHLVESLWPDAEGDVGHQSFATTLHRLRKILDTDQAMIVADGKVSLNPRCCWVDVWAFQRLANEVLEEQGVHKDPESAVRSVNKALAFYTGHFLAGDENQFWAISLRERLRNKMLRLVEKAGKLLERNRQFSEAVALYRQGLEYDNLVEEFYQRLMYCYSRLGNRCEIVSTFKSCCAILKTVDATPTSKTFEVYTQFLAEN